MYNNNIRTTQIRAHQLNEKWAKMERTKEREREREKEREEKLNQ